MKVDQFIYPHHIKVEGKEIIIYNKMGYKISKNLKIKRLGNIKLSKLAYGKGAMGKDSKGKITWVYLFEKNKDIKTEDYQNRLKLLGNININQL